jgi:hypothetical protein
MYYFRWGGLVSGCQALYFAGPVLAMIKCPATGDPMVFAARVVARSKIYRFLVVPDEQWRQPKSGKGFTKIA